MPTSNEELTQVIATANIQAAADERNKAIRERDEAVFGQKELAKELSETRHQVQSLRRALEAGKTCICGAFRLADAALASAPASTSGLDVVRVLRGWLAGAGCPAGNGYKPIPVPKELSQLSFNHMGILADYFEGLPASTSGVRSDSERLDWLEANWMAIGWTADGGGTRRLFIRPSLEQFATFRTAIDAAMSQRTGE